MNEPVEPPKEGAGTQAGEPAKPDEMQPGHLRQLWQFVKDNRSYYKSVALVMVFVGFIGLGFGYGIKMWWGAEQWGPFSEWVAGALTLAAVVVALRESLRGQHARLVDHEMARRRECLKAVGDVWSGLAQMTLYFTFFTDYLLNLPERFNANLPRRDNVPPDKPGAALAEDIGGRIQEFTLKWTGLVEPPLFYALAVLKDSPLDKPMRDLNAGIRAMMEEELPTVLKVVMQEGRSPDVAELDRQWKDVLRNRGEHLNLSREHFSLDLQAVERALSRPR